jgi:glucose/arabinose dehydrogenase
MHGFARLGLLSIVFVVTSGIAHGAVSAVPVVTGLDFPGAFTLASDGRIFHAERFTGQIRIYDPSNASDTLFFTVPDVETNGEQGLLGIALAPGYPSQPQVFAYATRDIAGTATNQILRIRDVGGTGTNMRVIWSSDVPAEFNHNGGRILFGPDDRLYAIVGDAEAASNSQNLANDAGKILRMKPSGTVPPSNPFPGSHIWAYGIRNSYGFGFDPMSGSLWETENGPSCNDELNRIVKGANYAWGPDQTCSTPPEHPLNTNQDGPSPVLPQVWFTPTTAPVGIAFCVGCDISSAEGAFFFGNYNDGTIRQGTLSGDRTTILSTTTVYSHSDSILSLERGPDGTVYFSDTSGIWMLIEE